MGCLAGRLPVETGVHACSFQGAYIYGFTLQENRSGSRTPADAGAAAQRRARTIGALNDYPYLAEIATKPPSYRYDDNLRVGLGLDPILDSLDHRRRAPRR